MQQIFLLNQLVCHSWYISQILAGFIIKRCLQSTRNKMFYSLILNLFTWNLVVFVTVPPNIILTLQMHSSFVLKINIHMQAPGLCLGSGRQGICLRAQAFKNHQGPRTFDEQCNQVPNESLCLGPFGANRKKSMLERVVCQKKM